MSEMRKAKTAINEDDNDGNLQMTRTVIIWNNYNILFECVSVCVLAVCCE